VEQCKVAVMWVTSVSLCDVCGMQTPSAPASLIKMEERTTH